MIRGGNLIDIGLNLIVDIFGLIQRVTRERSLHSETDPLSSQGGLSSFFLPPKLPTYIILEKYTLIIMAPPRPAPSVPRPSPRIRIQHNNNNMSTSFNTTCATRSNNSVLQIHPTNSTLPSGKAAPSPPRPAPPRNIHIPKI